MKTLTLILLVLIIFSCKKTKETQNINPTFKVEFKGALKNIMFKRDLSAKAQLNDYKEITHFYALGAIENLKGEIQIFDSKSYNTFVNDTILQFDKTFNKNASLFVYASVKKWKTIHIPSTIKTKKTLETYIEKTAKDNGINIHQPFPFLIEGKLKSFDWHVINWKDGDTEHSHEKHVNSGLHGTIKNREVKILGFYSDAHHTIFTHHSTNMHMHFTTKNKKIAGHLDDLILGKNMILKLPE